jgi:hypothetical protein
MYMLNFGIAINFHPKVQILNKKSIFLVFSVKTFTSLRCLLQYL